MESHCSEHLMVVYIVGYVKEVIKMSFCPAVIQYVRETLSEPGNPVTVMLIETIR